jgi:hypothetical protein
VPVNWSLARQRVHEALAIRNDDGPLLELLRYMDSVGQGPEKAAPSWWRGFRVLDSK